MSEAPLDFAAIDLPGAQIGYREAFLDAAEADALLAELSAAISWEQHRIRLFGREHPAPRLSCWIGDPGAAYTYSRTRFEPRPWPPVLDQLRRRVERACGSAFNSVLANLYRDGRDSMGWHADDEPELGAEPVIASLSLGATRRFLLQARDGSARQALPLQHGSLLLMAGATQRHYRHALPRALRVSAPRLNLTFRQVQAASPAARAAS